MRRLQNLFQSVLATTQYSFQVTNYQKIFLKTFHPGV